MFKLCSILPKSNSLPPLPSAYWRRRVALVDTRRETDVDLKRDSLRIVCGMHQKRGK
jgi:hypothetical protein